MDLRIGQGVDVHAFDRETDAPLVLGGVRIDDACRLAGHSDGDVVLHALIDALLGAAALGDIGTLVGVDQPSTKGTDSATFVARARALLHREGLDVVNIDLTVVAERPRLGPYRHAMRQRIAELLAVDISQVSVKATTTDRLGFIGRGEGVACTAVASVRRRAAQPHR